MAPTQDTSAGSEPRLSAFVLMILTLLFVFGLLSRVGKVVEPAVHGSAVDPEVARISTIIGNGRSPASQFSDLAPARVDRPASGTVQAAISATPEPDAATTAGTGMLADNPIFDVLPRDDRYRDASAQPGTTRTDAATVEPEGTSEDKRVVIPARDRKGDRLGPGPEFAAHLPAEQRDTEPKTAPEIVKEYVAVRHGLPAPAVKAPAERIHVVKKGETLWKIAETYYQNGKAWNRIAAANKGLTPERLHAGRRLRIPPAESLALGKTDD